MRVAAVIPVKALAEAKSRLASVLSARERADLALWMLERVLRAVAASGAVSDVFVVTPDRHVLEWVGLVALAPSDSTPNASTVGAYRGMPVVPVLQQSGDLNAALELGLREALTHQACGLIVLPGDLPLLQAAEIREMVRIGRREYGRLTEAGRSDGATETGIAMVAPDRLGTGTNALFMAPPTAMPFAFGAGSRVRHEALARERGLRMVIYRSKGVAFDVDGPAELDRLGWPGPRWPRSDAPSPSARGRADERTAR